MVMGDKHVALGLVKDAPKSLPPRLYSPEPIALIGCRLALENSEAVMEFVRKNSALLRKLPRDAPALAVIRFARGEDVLDVLDKRSLTCLKECAHNVVDSSIPNRR